MSLRDKEVIVIDEDGQEMKIKQFCQQILDNDLALISGTNYDNENKVYHRYLDCYEDWAEPLKHLPASLPFPSKRFPGCGLFRLCGG